MASLVVIDLTLDSDDDVAVVLSAPRLRISMKTKPSEQDLASISSNPPALSLKPSTTSLNLNVEVADGFDTSIFDDEAELELLEKIAAVKQITVLVSVGLSHGCTETCF